MFLENLKNLKGVLMASNSRLAHLSLLPFRARNFPPLFLQGWQAGLLAHQGIEGRSTMPSQIWDLVWVYG